MKRFFTLLTALIMTALLALNMVGCKKEKENSPPPEQVEKEFTLILKENNLDLFVGENYTVEYRLLDQDGFEYTPTTLSFDTDNDNIAEIENGVITAKAVGSTYVTITADGVSSSCFVEIKDGVRGEIFEIRFSSQKLYSGVPVQAFVYRISDGVIQGIVENAVWSVEDQTALSVSQTGVVTALKDNVDVTINAQIFYNGVDYQVEKTMSVIPPINYVATRSVITLAGTKTYAGKTNESYVSTSVNITALNSLTGTVEKVTGDKLSITNTSKYFSHEIDESGKITFTAKEGQIGTDVAYVNILGTELTCLVKVNVAYAISTIEDMDRLAVASFARSHELAYSYVMVNDIDYAGKAVYPIALWTQSQRYYGYQWKYALDFDENTRTYVCVARENFGKAGYGLTESEYKTFAISKGINPNNVPFSGTFDGNGFAIKNAKLMFAPLVNTSYESNDTGVFGIVDGGTVKNLGVDLVMQKPTDIVIEDDPLTTDIDEEQVGLNKVYRGDIIDITYKTNGTNYGYRNAALIVRANAGTVENVRLTIDYNGMNAGNQDGALIQWNTGSAMRFNVVEVKQPNVNKTLVKGLSVAGDTGTSGRVENNLVIGTRYFKEGFGNYPTSMVGTKGNWLTHNDSWASLYSVQKGASVSNYVSLEDVLSAYRNSGVWSIVGCNATDGKAPTLINGCSIPEA